MASVGPPQPPPGSSSASSSQPPQIPPNSDQITWEGDKMFNIYILDYCKKRGYNKTASQLVAEAEIPPESKPPINAQQGLLFEWWSVFWVLFQAKNSGNGSEDALLYTRYQNQAKFQRPGQVPPPQPPARYPLPNGVPGPIPPLPSAQTNGIGPSGPPLSLSAPPPYAPTNPATQPNGIPGPPAPPGPPGQPFAGGMVGRPPIGAQQRLSNGAPQYQSPTIAPSPQLQGNPQQTQTGPMGQLGRSPHMSNMNKAAMLPPNGPQGPGPAGSAHQTSTPAYPQLGRPPSRHDSSSHHPMNNPHRSPALAGRMPPGQDRSHMDGPHSSLDAELASYPPELVGEAKLRAGLGNRDAQSLSVEEKQVIIQNAIRLKPGSSGGNMPGQLQNRGPMAQPMQQQLSMQQQRGAKRNSTSPGEEHETLPRNDQSPPERKRLRKTPNPAEQQQQSSQPQQQQQSQSQPQQPQQQPQQLQQQQQPPQQQPQQPPMAHMGQLPPGSQPMAGTGPVRGPVSMGNGFSGPQMHQMGMGPMTPMHGMSPSMVHGPPPGVVLNQQMAQSQLYAQNQYRQAMAMQKNNPNAPLPPVGPGDPQSQAHVRGAGPPGANRLPGQLGPPQPPKPMGGSMPPLGQPGMGGPQKPSGKEGEGELGGPLNPPPPTPTPTSLLTGAPPMNPQRPPTAGPVPTLAPSSQAPAPGPMADIYFDMADMFGISGGDFDFNTNPLNDMELHFDTSVHDGSSLDMK
ncbi:hypothetical protein BJV78DRAFT_1285203 [Lactifluus subvellereus]|nr:hypothetical protein BJV78DRAFT_1285203 [Lactifluus subvellereus]